MNRLLISTILCFTSLPLYIATSFAKEKGQKGVQERFDASIIPPLSSNNSLSVAIQEFSSEEEVQDLARTFAQGGKDGLDKALAKIKKGYFIVAGGLSMPLLVITSSSDGTVRRLNLIGLAPTHFEGEFGGSVSVGHRGYPYTYIQLEIDEQGNGKGRMVLYASVTFDPQGRTMIKPMARGTHQLVNVVRRE